MTSNTNLFMFPAPSKLRMGCTPGSIRLHQTGSNRRLMRNNNNTRQIYKLRNTNQKSAAEQFLNVSSPKTGGMMRMKRTRRGLIQASTSTKRSSHCFPSPSGICATRNQYYNTSTDAANSEEMAITQQSDVLNWLSEEKEPTVYESEDSEIYESEEETETSDSSDQSAEISVISDDVPRFVLVLHQNPTLLPSIRASGG